MVGNRADDNDRFGMPASAIATARAEHSSGIYRMGMYVPTRREVREAKPDDLEWILDLWMHECPVEIIPTNEQIAEVLFELMRRPDADDDLIKKIAASCRAYIGDKPPER